MTVHKFKPISARIKALFEEAYGLFPVPVTITDKNRQFVWVNKACSSFYGRKPKEFLGQTASLLIPPSLLEPQKPSIQTFNNELGTSGYSINRFINSTSNGEVGVLVIAFERQIGVQSFRIGVAVADGFTSFAPALCNMVIGSAFDHVRFLSKVRMVPRHFELLKELASGKEIKNCETYPHQRAARKALLKIAAKASKCCSRKVAVSHLRSLALILAPDLLPPAALR